jgi:Ankyrin repeats (3 copies)
VFQLLQKISFMGRVCPSCHVDKSRDKGVAVWAGGAVLALAFGFAVGIAVGISMRAVSLHSSRERVSFAARIKSVGESNKTRSTIDSTEPPLVRAIWAGDRDSLARLIARGADVNVRDKSGNDPALLLAVEHGLPFVQLLVQAGADVKQTNSAGLTALHQAAYVGDPAIADYLLKKGADINAKTAEGDTPLSLAAAFGRFLCAFC